MIIIERITLSALIALLLISCQPMENLHPDVHGHRGFTSMFPENSIPGFLAAVEVGCDFLELDVVVSGDGQVVVSHEPWMHSGICLLPDGTGINAADERSYNLHHMSVEQIQAFDCGSKGNPIFPDQKPLPTYKPTLREVVEQADEHALLNGMMSPGYMIEAKSDAAWYGTYQPLPAAYATVLIATIDSLGIASRTVIQSFDTAILEAVHAERPDLLIALLVENHDILETNLSRLTFKPNVYCVSFHHVNKALLQALRQLDIELVTWTVNDMNDIRRMLNLGVDGIISDYPDRVLGELEGRE